MVRRHIFVELSGFESALHSYMRSSHAEFLALFNEKGDYNDEIANSLKAALEEFKTNHTY